LPHELWAFWDGTRIYIALENGTDTMTIDTVTNQIIATTPGGQSSQVLVYEIGNFVPQEIQPLEAFQTNFAGIAIVITVKPVKRIISSSSEASASVENGNLQTPVQIQLRHQGRKIPA
jgi:DNA-binding beta-propeller fold protein YncE